MSLIHMSRGTGSRRSSVVIGETKLSDLSSESDIEIRSAGETVFTSSDVSGADDSDFETAIADLLDEVREGSSASKKQP